jgi:hypothetical protein
MPTPTALREAKDLLAEAKRLTPAGPTEPPLWTALPGPQERAYYSAADVLGYGGAAGGGKSQLLLGLALTRHRRSIIFRKEAVQGRGLIDDARAILGTLGSFNEQAGLWRDLPGGRTVEFAGVKDPGSEHKYKGRPHDFIGFDEADFIPQHVVRFLMGWLRTEVVGQRCRVVMCFNPPATAEGRWVVDYFAPWVDPKHPRPAAPGELRWYAMGPEGKEVECRDHRPVAISGKMFTPKSRTFIPARVTDNPYYTATNYIAQLQALPEPLRSQLLEGDMAAGVEDDPWQVIPTAWVKAAMLRWGPEPPAGQCMTSVGVDVARGGRDQTVIRAAACPLVRPAAQVPRFAHARRSRRCRARAASPPRPRGHQH